ncbi:zinc-finger of mitochondrial splicing suppressor 51-domain-containing protein [Dipodascopsis uninucleata]
MVSQGKFLKNGGQRAASLWNAFKWTLGLSETKRTDGPTFENRFHPWESSPSLALRNRAATIKAFAKCPVTGDSIEFTCPNCGIPTHHSEQAWESDDKHHSEICEKLALSNVFEHDIRSGREFAEFQMPSPQEEDVMINFANWDTFLYTRNFHSMDTEFELAHSTKILTYPITVGSVLHQGSPYTMRNGRLSLEGLKSLAALRYSLFPTEKSPRAGSNTEIGEGLSLQPIRLFILGARSEAQLPFEAWSQLLYLFDGIPFHIHFIGPETLYDRQRKQYIYAPDAVTERISSQLTVSYYTDYFHVIHESQAFTPYDPYYDVFFLFHPGLGAPEAMDRWEKSVPILLESKCAVFSTGFHETDIKRDWDWLHTNFEDEMDVLMTPGQNIFQSTKWEIDDLHPDKPYQANQQIFGFRGKRYPAIFRGGLFSGVQT